MSQGILLRATALLSLVTGISEGVAKRLSPCYHHSWLAYQPALQPKDRFCNLETIYFLEFKDDERQSSKKKKRKKRKKKKNHVLAGAGLYLLSGGVYIMKHFLFMSVHPLENKQ